MRSPAAPVAVVLASVLALAGCRAGGAPDPPPSPGSTLERTLVDPDGNGVLAPGPGEPLAERTELAPAGEPLRTLATFAQLSDAHVTDEESPLRLEAVDRLGGAVRSSARPHEALTVQVLAAAMESVNALPLDAVLVSGDLVDNAQANELDWALGALRGETVRPDSGAPGYVGVQEQASADPFVYRPDLDAPRHPGLLERAQEPVATPGLRAPWLPAVSNHDVLVQGLLRADPALRAVATGGRKLAVPSREAVDAARAGVLDRRRLDALLVGDRAGTFRPVPPDPRRAPLEAVEAVERIAGAAGVPTRGGFLTYSRLIAPGVRAVVLDTADRAGGADGVLDAGQLAWLERTLAAHAGERLIVVSPTPLESTGNGERALGLLDRAPGVVAVLSGNAHATAIRARRTGRGGYWLVRAPSLVDFPQQARAFRLVALAGGRVALETWMVDHAGAPGAPGALGLAGVSRGLAYLDAQGGRPQGFAGEPSDRNARLYLP